MKKIVSMMAMVLCGCVGIPEGIQPVQDFNLEKYLGTWYEIARLDHSFERGLEKVTANYTMREDSGVKVLNRGFNTEKNEWKEAEGKAYFVGSADVGQLKVSFFGPFYGGYNIIALDKENYQYAMVCGPDTSYLWILARSADLSPEIIDKLVTQAKELGFATDQLIYVKH